MRDKTTHVYTDIHPPVYGPDDRPALALTALAYDELRTVPTLTELLKRKGAAGLQLCIDELTWFYQDKNGFDWLYVNAEVYTQGKLYFIRLEDGSSHYLGSSYRHALDYLMDYIRNGRSNRAMTRSR